MKLYKCIHISLISDTLYIFILFIFIHFISLVYLSLHFVSLFFLYKDLFKNISSGNLDSSLCFFQPSVSHDVLCIQVK